MNKIVEVCCGSYYDALQASIGGAQRIELNSALHLGGLTPSLATLKKTKENTDLKVICMVRNRGAGFCYLEADSEILFEDASILLENGADGIAFGFLNEDKSIDIEKTKAMVQLIHAYQKEAVFHRAVDVTSDYMQAIADVVACGCDRILTSGGSIKAIEGVKQIKKAQDEYGAQIELVAGCGINVDNASYVLENTGIHQVHSSCKAFLHDATTANYGVDFSYAITSKYEVVDSELVKALIASL